MIYPEREIQLDIPHIGSYGGLDLRLMERVLDNLVNNALRYCEQRLRIGLWFNGHLACLQVEDDGPAFPADKRQRVLAPFVRLDPSHDRATGGCGLGLAIVHSIAVAYQGKCLSRAAPLAGPASASAGH